MKEPDWNDFKVLLALASGGSVAAAARDLGVDGSTVSRRLAAIEDSVGARLLVRGGQQFSWTPEGRTMLAAAETIRAEVSRASGAVRAAKADATLAVTVSCPSGLGATIARLLSEAREKHPNLVVDLAGENRAVDLAKGEADLALRMFRPEDPALVYRHAFDLGWAVYASKSYLEEQGHPATPADLGRHRLVRYVSALHKVAGPRWLEEHRGAAAVSMQVDNTEVAANMIAAGGGVGVIPCVLAEGRPEMMRVFPDPIARAQGFIVYHETVRDKACVRSAVDVLLELFEANRGLFSGC
ncbi:MAG TPA: LysR family transcriptional regulator [Polyangiaceae bacterium]|nr:LysR family transcriptional regulator [Polyangiaceae bacterium]